MAQSDPSAQGPWCRGCGYDLAAVHAPVCPECGRAFDRADPATVSLTRRGWSWRRTRRGLAVLAVVMLAAVVLVPRGYVRVTIKVTCVDCGLQQTTIAVRPLAPTWWAKRGEALWVWPAWTTTSIETSPSDGACGHRPSFSVAARKRLYTIRGVKAGGMMGASGGGTSTHVGTINGQPLTDRSAPAVARAMSAQMARTAAFGVRTGSKRRED